MTYEEIRALPVEKQSHPKAKMLVMNFGRFSVMSSERVPGIIVDSDIAEKISHRKWCIDSGGYPVANFGGQLIRLYDFVMAQKYAEKPKGWYVDHINLDKLDNRRANLRLVTPTINAQNTGLKGNNTSGVTGVSKSKEGTYRAYITYNKKRIDLGRYPTLQEAANARKEAEARYDFKTQHVHGRVREITIRELCEQE